MLGHMMDIEEQIVLRGALPDWEEHQVAWLDKVLGDQREIQWGRVIELALFHEVFPSIYLHLKNLGWRIVPEAEVKRFHELWQRHLARNIILVEELNRLLALLAEEGVKVVILKGIILAGKFYPNLVARSFNDLDLWVRPEDMERVGKILRANGFESRVSYNLTKPIENDYATAFYKCFPKAGRIYIDLHWRLGKLRDYKMIPEDAWWEKALRVDINEQQYWSLAPEDMLIYLSMQIHASNYMHLKHFVDLHQFFIFENNYRLNWDYIHRTAQDMGILINFYFMLLTTSRLFQLPDNVPVIRPKGRRLRLYFLNRLLNPQTIIQGRYGRDLRQGFCLLLQDRPINSVLSSLKILFPSRGALAARYRLWPQSKTIYLYYLLNPFLVLYWVIRGLIIKATDGDGLGELLGPLVH